VFRLRIGFSSILVANNLEASEEKKISRIIAMDDLVAESGLLIVAGGDTTATGITATLFYLLPYTETFAVSVMRSTRLSSDTKATTWK
jgi:cytochrome P450